MAQLRVAYIVQHPVQYHAPFFRRLAARREIRLTVLYCENFGPSSGFDADFRSKFKWDVPLLGGYDHEFLRNVSPLPFVPSRAFFWRLINPGVIPPIVRGSFDVVAIHGYAISTYWLAFLAARLRGVPVVLAGESVWLPANERPKGGIRERLLRALCSRAGACAAIGTSSRRFYEAHGVPRDRIFLAPYAVDNDFFIREAARRRRERAAALSRWNLPPDRPMVMFSGKLIERKRPGDVLEALDRCGLDVSLLVVGDGPLREDLRRRVANLNRVHAVFTGFQNQSAMPGLYALADVFVMPSGPGETFGLAVNEAMCAGLPVIASDRVPCAEDLVEAGANGFVYPAGHVELLGGYLKRLLRDSKLRRSMGKASLGKIRSWNHRRSADGFVQAVLHAFHS
ncbi:MAG: glycosyltransferase family 4 protein [Nitrospirae bacterium]|nr:glycosyltransferase family 4 protein [Nitrospirota bacterium]